MKADEAGAEGTAVTGRQLADEGFGELVVRVSGECGVQRLEDRVRGVAFRPVGRTG